MAQECEKEMILQGEGDAWFQRNKSLIFRGGNICFVWLSII